jgi:hypothetical protein
MIFQLTLHPDHHCPQVSQISVEVNRWGGAMLDLRYRIDGDMAVLRLAAVAPSVRADNLWQATCVEAFVREQGKASYCELNFAPSTAWAAYCFSGYRADMADAQIAPHQLSVRQSADYFELNAAILLDLSDEALWSIGLSAIVEQTNGDKSCWALRHPPGKADFHHDAGFAATLSGTAV